MLKRLFALSLCLLIASPLLAQSGSQLTFPRLLSTAEFVSTGIAIVNPSTTSANVELRMYGSDGALLGTTTAAISAGGQYSKLVSELFPGATRSGWITGTSTSSGLQSFWLGGDFSTSTDGSTSSPVTPLVLFPLITTETEISIANLSQSPDTVTVALLDQNGTIVASSPRNVTANGVIQGRVSELIPGVAIPASQPVYVLGVGSLDTSQLAGTSVTRGFLSSADSVVINGGLPIDQDLRIPYVVSGVAGGSNYTTAVGVTNLGDVSATVNLTLNSPSRSVTVQRTIPAFGTLRSTVSDLFGIPNVVGWIRITSTADTTAWAAYADTIGGGSSIVPAENTSSAQLIFGHIADLNPWWTGIGLLNGSPSTAEIEVYAITPTGSIIDGPATSSLARFSLAPGSNRAFLLGEVVPRTQTRSSDGGFVLVRSTNRVPLYGFELFFLRSGRVFANVPGSPAIGFTPPGVAPLASAVDVIRAYSSDFYDVEKISFLRGEPIRLQVDRNSTFSDQITVQSRYLATGPSQYVLTDTTASASTAPSGPHRRFVEVIVPQDAPTGPYTFQASVTNNGVTSTKTGAFEIMAGSPQVEVSRAFTTDTSDVDKTTFAVGQPIRFVMQRNNTLSGQVTVQARYRVTDPSQSVIIDEIVPTSTATPGVHFRFIEGTLPAGALSGSYTFDASATYNGVTSTKSTTFTITGGTAISADESRQGRDSDKPAKTPKYDRLRGIVADRLR